MRVGLYTKYKYILEFIVGLLHTLMGLNSLFST